MEKNKHVDIEVAIELKRKRLDASASYPILISYASRISYRTFLFLEAETVEE